MVKIKDNSADVRQRISDFGGFTLEFGFIGRAGGRRYKRTGTNVATVALFNEFGTMTVPQRSFFRSTLFEKRAEIQEAIAEAAHEVIVKKRSPKTALSKLGKFIIGLIKQKIDRSLVWAKRNAVSTIKRKGFDYPLHDLFIMSESLRYRIRNAAGQFVVQEGRL